MSDAPPVRALRPADGEFPDIERDPDRVRDYLNDASGTTGGWTTGLAKPRDERQVCALVREAARQGWRLLPQAARTSVTGGSVPRGELVVSVERLRGARLPQRGDPPVCRVGAGWRLDELQRELASRGFYYPPVPTYRAAMIGGAVSTNAGGAASFKYGATRDWVRGLRVVLASGDILDVRRGDARVRQGDAFDVVLGDGSRVAVPAPTYRLPPLRKISAGYHTADPLDLVDLFVGAEGTLGLITEIELELVPKPAEVVVGAVFVEDEAQGLRLGASLRDAGRRGREAPASGEPDVRAVEWLGAGCLDLVREPAARTRLPVPPGARAALVFEIELARLIGPDAAVEQIAAVLEGRAPTGDAPLGRLAQRVAAAGALDGLDLAFPGDPRRARAIAALREAVPLAVNERLTAAGVPKFGGDLVVPEARLDEMVARCARVFESEGLDHAVWGHLSDGNLHPNALPRAPAQCAAARRSILRLADEAVALGGCPLSEHGVGRNPLKQELLRRFLGDRAIAEMRRIKHALDPAATFAPGVLFADVADAARRPSEDE